MLLVSLLAELLLALLAVFGLYALLRVLLTARALSFAALVLHIPADTAPEALPQLVRHAREQNVFCAGARLIALVERGADERLLSALKAANLTYYIIDLEGRE